MTEEQPDPGGIGRREFLRSAAVAGLAGAVVGLDPLDFAAAAPPADGEQTRTLTGRFEPGAPDWVYVPVAVPPGVRRLAVSYTYDRPSPPPGAEGNALDIGLFDADGYGLGDEAGFRGWSGGFRTEFFVSRGDATPGYLPGPVRAGTWHVLLAPYTVAPQGMAWTLEVTLTFGPPGPPARPNPAPIRATGRGAAWYRGDMHVHTVHSDGQRTPAELAAAARAAGLDYVVSTEHNTSSASRVWGEHAGPDLLVVDGEEVTTRNGHYLALGLRAGDWVDWRYRAVDGRLPRFVREIHASGALAVAAHPHTPCLGCAWKFGYTGFDAVEVWNGPWTLDDEAAVATWDGMLVAGGRQGRWLPAVGNSDAHTPEHAVGLPQNAVYADDLTKEAVLAGVRAGRVWIAESAAVDLALTASSGGRTADVGERLEVDEDAAVEVRLAVSGAPGCGFRLVTDQGARLQGLVPAAGGVTWTTTPRNASYVRAEVRRLSAAPTAPGAMVALTNPVFLGRRRSD